MNTPAAIRVAIVDDDVSLCRSLMRLLRQAGFDPYVFYSAEEFLLLGEDTAFACLLVDIELSGLSGIALHKRLLAAGCRTPVIYITAFDDPAARTEAMRQGCVGFFRKSDAGAEIIATLKRASGPQQRPGSP